MKYGYYVSKEEATILASLSGTACKVLNWLIILNLQSEKDYILTSANHLMYYVGLTKPPILKALKELKEKGVIERKIYRKKSESGGYSSRSIYFLKSIKIN